MTASRLRAGRRQSGRRHGILRRAENRRQPEGVPVADEPSDGASPEEVAQAVFSTIWRLYSDSPLPVDAPRLDLEDGLDIIAGTDQLSGPAKLELLARVVRSGQIEADNESVRGLADRLVSPVVLDLAQRADVSNWLLEQLKESREGQDPLGRETALDIGHLAPQFQSLVPDIHVTVVALGVTCEAHPIVTNGQKALSIYTFATTNNQLAGYRDLVNPLHWPDCPVQGVVFKSMDPVDPGSLQPPGQLQPLATPDDGWTATLKEVVDLGFGILPQLRFTTYLDFVFFDNQTNPPAATDAIGCTYDLHPGAPTTGIVVDRGYLLVDDYPSNPAMRRIQTLKEVYFASAWMDLFLNPSVCTIWSVTSAIIGYACLGSAQAGGGPP
jgi:hypothetical protein